MYRKASILVLVLILSFIMGGVGVYAVSTNNVKDFMGYLSQSEAEQLQAEIENIKNTHKLDAVIVITDNTGGKSSRAFADDYYDNNGYGVGNDYSGLLMLINMKQREVWISTSGRAIDIFTDSRISKILDRVANPLSNGNFSSACKTFLSDVVNYAETGVPYGQYRSDSNEPLSYKDRVFILMKSFPVYIFAFIVALIATLLVSISSKGKVTISNRTYEKSGSFALTSKVDNFIREHTSRIRIESSSSGSSSHRSSTHRSSSGRSHGGGGRKF